MKIRFSFWRKSQESKQEGDDQQKSFEEILKKRCKVLGISKEKKDLLEDLGNKYESLNNNFTVTGKKLDLEDISLQCEEFYRFIDLYFGGDGELLKAFSESLRVWYQKFEEHLASVSPIRSNRSPSFDQDLNSSVDSLTSSGNSSSLNSGEFYPIEQKSSSPSPKRRKSRGY